MGRRGSELEPARWGSMVLLLMGLVSFCMVYIFMSTVMRPSSSPLSSADSRMGSLGYDDGSFGGNGGNSELETSGGGGCCRGVPNLELWGAAVKWGTDFKFNSSEQCCKACKAMCTGKDGPCLCDSWVFCGNKEACGEKFGECWLKKQKDVLFPDKQETGNKIMWTSGVIFGRGEGIIALETDYGTLHIKLLPECSPHSVAYMLELLSLRHCAGCHFYRAESRGQFWDIKGNHIKDASYGPPFALIQGTLEAQALTFNPIPSEHRSTIRRGSVAWVGSGPEFFISLADHEEWRNSYTVFGSVLPEDMAIAEKIARLPTKADVWNNINVSVLEKTVPLKFQRINLSHSDLNLSAD
ncbi:peptidyl-prolyl cis-trans isomerase [Perilla frutescens var. hirtella]|uniref:Peptidyl-prolyl cis-trans isomerase n=1 Tax=Perilla frutescens var. hirtella TaxID=608512 RepID=A0AAD4JQP8_PERFH|nr:peptidyl-prolyl cis-trans isomerase [Perilla frutescens var. hirtella]